MRWQWEVVAKFDGAQISSDGDGLLLREVEKRTGILRRLAQQFDGYRDPEAIAHSVLVPVGLTECQDGELLGREYGEDVAVGSRR